MVLQLLGVKARGPGGVVYNGALELVKLTRRKRLCRKGSSRKSPFERMIPRMVNGVLQGLVPAVKLQD